MIQEKKREQEVEKRIGIDMRRLKGKGKGRMTRGRFSEGLIRQRP